MSFSIGERRRYVSQLLKRCYEHRSGDVQLDQATDILADMLHWCDAGPVDFDSLVRKARVHHEAEKDEAANGFGPNDIH